MPVALVSTTPSLYKQTTPSSFVWSPFHKLTFTSYSAVCVSAFPSNVTVTVNGTAVSASNLTFSGQLATGSKSKALAIGIKSFTGGEIKIVINLLFCN